MDSDQIIVQSVSYDEESQWNETESSSWRKCDLRNHKKKLMCSCLSVIILFMILIGAAVTLSVLLTKSPTTEPKEKQSISKTTEFQIKLVHLSRWNSRDEMIESYMEYFEHKSKYFQMNEAEVQFGARRQYSVKTKGEDRCGIDHYIRVREYISGNIATNTTVDIKGNAESEEEAGSYPYWPAPAFSGNCRQKNERDEHECSHKYSRESRIIFDEPQAFVSCADVVKLFPWAFHDISIVNLGNYVEVSSFEDWYVQEYSGYLDSDTQYKVAFTMRYASTEESLDPTAEIKSGEWSIRLYSLKDGASDKYNENVYSDVTNAWKALMQHFGNDDC